MQKIILFHSALYPCYLPKHFQNVILTIDVPMGVYPNLIC